MIPNPASNKLGEVGEEPITKAYAYDASRQQLLDKRMLFCCRPYGLEPLTLWLFLQIQVLADGKF